MYTLYPSQEKPSVMPTLSAVSITIPEEICTAGDVIHLVNHLSTTTISSASIRDWTSRDTIILKVKRFLLLSWPTTPLGDDFKPFTTTKE